MALKDVGPLVPSALKQAGRQVRSHSLPTNHSALPAEAAALQLAEAVAAGAEQVAEVRLAD
jgi:hypothetical protein